MCIKWVEKSNRHTHNHIHGDMVQHQRTNPKYLQKYLYMVYNVHCMYMHGICTQCPSIYCIIFPPRIKIFEGRLYSWNMSYSFFISS